MGTEDMEVVVKLIHSAFQLGAEIQTSSGPKLVDFKKACHEETWSSKINSLTMEVKLYSLTWSSIMMISNL